MDQKEEVVAVIQSDSSTATVQETEMGKEVTAVEMEAGAIVINTDEDYESAAAFGRTIKQKTAQVQEFFAPMKKAAHDAHANICAREKAILAPLVEAERILKKTMGNYLMEVERRRKEEEERQRLAAQAEADKKLQEAMALESAGKTDEAEAALEEADFVDSIGRNITVSAEKPKAAGTSSTVDWEIVSVDDSKVPIDVAGICIRPVDTKAVLKLIRASKGQIKIPGVAYKTVAKLSFKK